MSIPCCCGYIIILCVCVCNYKLPMELSLHHRRPSYDIFTLSYEPEHLRTLSTSTIYDVPLSALQKNCLTVKDYIDGPLGHYVINVTSAAKLCSKALCKKNGRCVRKSLDSDAYLHLNPRFFHIRRNPSSRGPLFHVSGHLNNHDILDMKHKFTCQCYQGWTGVYCEMPQTPAAVPPQMDVPLPHPRKNGLLGDILLLLSLHFSCLCMIMFLGLCLIIKCLIL